MDSLNAARKGLYGAMAQLAHLHPELPSNYAELFFLREKGAGVRVNPLPTRAQAPFPELVPGPCPHAVSGNGGSDHRERRGRRPLL